MEKREFLIHELAENSGVTVRTIRYYTIEGLLPQPVIHGKFAYYTEEHLHRLELIRQLKEAYLPLREIRQTMSTLSDAEVQERIKDRLPDGIEPARAQPTAAKSAEGGAMALDYITRLMSQQSSMRAPGEQSKTPPQIREPQPAYAGGKTDQTWRRIELAPGVELHIRQPAEPLSPQAVQHIITALRSQLQAKP